jgi:hypothetical protein
MKYLLIAIILLACYAPPGYAQSYTVKGSVTDTFNATSLSMASVVLFRQADSVIAAHTRTGPDGHFQLSVAAQGKYFLRITFPSFADYVEVINVKKSVTDLHDLPLVSKEHLLKEFVLTQQISAIKIKGDTTEYMADSFKVKENATVEDLLKKLPGIQVDKDGQIVAQGETVQKILVDGEEFFSDDPKVVTRGLQANAVSKVQVYDKKSDQAEFTGIDDGQKTKTINLELKEDKKKGYFGKLDAGGGSDGYFQNQAMVNAFKAKRQLSVFGITSNTDRAGLGWQDNDKFGSGNGTTEISSDGEIMTTYNQSDDDFTGWNGKYNGEGLPKTWTGGAHYADKWHEDKDHLSVNYRYAMQDVEIDGNTISQNSLPGDSLRLTNASKTQFSRGERHGIDIVYDWKIDSTTTLKLTSNSGFKNTQTASIYNTVSALDANDAELSNSVNHRDITSNANANFINTDLLLRKKFAKKGRTLSVDVKENYKDSKSTGIFKSQLLSGTSDIATNQRKINDANTLAFSGKATYTEPLSKVAYLEGDYGVAINNSDAVNKSFDSNGVSSYSDVANSTFSSDYKYNILSNVGGLNLKFVYKKVNFSFGSDVSNAAYIQTDHLHGDTSKTYNYVNLFPKANFSYKLSKQTSLNFMYRGSTRQPSITQIQPLVQNTDPLNITVGNPNLKQEFNNEVTLRFNDYKVLSSRYFWSSFTFTSTQDAISTDQTTGLVNTTRYINVDGNHSGYGYIGYGAKIKKLDIDVGMQVNGGINHINSIVNGLNNVSDNNNISFGPYVGYEKEKVLELRWNPRITFNGNSSTNNPAANMNYYILNSNVDGSVQLPKKFEIGSTVDVMVRQKTDIFTTNNNVVKWNAYLEKKFLKKSQLVLRVSVFDILNQNIGFSRTATGSIITQNSYNTIKRYGMINLVWNFTHTPAGAPAAAQDGGMMMMH